MNDIELRHNIDEVHLRVLRLGDKDLTTKWWALLHDLLIMEDVPSEKAKHIADKGKCVNDKNRDCDCELFCTFWKSKLEKL